MKETALLGVGHLAPIRPGRLEGKATFDVRGTFDISLEPTRRDESGDFWYARLTVKNWSCEVMQIKTRFNPDAEPEPEYWHSEILIEGYAFRVKLIPGDGGWRAEFWDTGQPKNWEEIAPEFFIGAEAEQAAE